MKHNNDNAFSVLLLFYVIIEPHTQALQSDKELSWVLNYRTMDAVLGPLIVFHVPADTLYVSFSFHSICCNIDSGRQSAYLIGNL